MSGHFQHVAPRERPAPGRLWPPLGFVLATLFALLVIPMVIDRRIAALQSQVEEVADPASRAIAELQQAISLQASAVRAFVITGDDGFRDRFEEARIAEETALGRLRPLARRIGSEGEAGRLALETALATWHQRQLMLMEHRVSPEAFVAELGEQDVLFQRAAAALDRLHEAVDGWIALRRQRIRDASRLGAMATGVLGLLALTAAVVVARLGDGLQRRTLREMELRRALQARRAGDRLLADASRALVATMDYEETLGRVAVLAVPALADVCIIDLLEDGSLRRIAAAHGDPTRQRLARGLEAFPPLPDERHPLLRTLRTGHAEVVDGARADFREAIARSPEHRRIIQEVDPRSVMLVPMIARGRAVGGMQLASTDPTRVYDSSDLALAEALADRAALAIDNARLFRESERRALGEEALRKATEAISATFTVEGVVQEIATRAVEATGADGALVERLDADGGHLEAVAVAGELVPRFGSRTAYESSYAQLVLERSEPVVVARLAGATRRLPELPTPCPDCSAVVVPLLDAGEPVGALTLLRRAGRAPFRPDEIRRAHTFGDLAALAFRRIHLLEESENKREELMRVMESRARLVRGFSHDVKNPLGAADGYLQLLELGQLGGRLEPRQAEAVGKVRRSLGSAIALIDELLDVARAEAGRITLERVAVDLREAVRLMAEEYRAQARAKGLTLALELPERLPLVESDAERVRQILGNLLSNAVKFTDEGGISVRVGEPREGGPGPGDWICIEVADSGLGIPEERQKELFQEFRRLEPGTSGAGVGLAFSQRLAGALGGRITVDSRPGAGSRFTLWLPARRS